jgi:hypothetical protein
VDEEAADACATIDAINFVRGGYEAVQRAHNNLENYTDDVK